jgi:uncharacterized membrane protein YfcA
LETGFFILISASAFLYASVGHGGASAYLAAMALWGMQTGVMKPLALLLNSAVSLLAFYQFWKAGYFKASLLLPLVLCSLPFAFLGGSISVDVHWYKRLLGIFLLIACLGLLQPLWRSVWKTSKQENGSEQQAARIPLNKGLLAVLGICIGFVSGLLGIGGGILLSPVLLYFRWTDQKQTAALSAGFILMNSLAGLAGQLRIAPAGFMISDDFGEALRLFTVYGPAVVCAGFLGAYFGSKRFSSDGMRGMLGLVLLIAAFKLVSE